MIENEKCLDKANFVCPAGLGDTLILCGLRRAIEKKYNVSIHYFIKPTQEIVMKMYGIKDYSIKIFDTEELVKLSNINSDIKVGEYFVAHPFYMLNGNELLIDFYEFRISFIDMYKKAFGLDNNVEFT